MENVYQPELWRDAYVMLGTAAAALIGLLFVVTSLHLEVRRVDCWLKHYVPDSNAAAVREFEKTYPLPSHRQSRRRQ